MRGPIFVSGRIVTDLGRPVPEPVGVELNCDLKPLQVIQTDLGGYFTFSLGMGGSLQANTDFSASNESPTSTLRSPLGSLSGSYRNSLSGCELRLAVPGYHPLNYTITEMTDMGRIEVGTLRLNRIASMKGSAISVTSLLVPKNAEKEFAKGLQEMQKNRPDHARPYLEKAIGLYDRYAAAWNELGRTYLATGDNDKALQAFEKSIAADPDYIPPHLNLATLQLQSHQWENAIETAAKVLALDPSVSFANFAQAVGHFNLNHLDTAEKSAREAEKAPHPNLPQVHALLAELLLRREAYSDAAEQMRAYLQESPKGQYADQMHRTLEEIGQRSSQAAPLAEPPEPLEPLQTKP